jgi:hypothetical protein
MCTKMQLDIKQTKENSDDKELRFFMGNVPIKNSVKDVIIRNGNCVRCKQNCVYKQNDISVKVWGKEI